MRGSDELPVLEMYRRLEAALGKAGADGNRETAYEFALTAGGELAERIEHRRVSHLPRRVVEAFYRVRFGGHTLDNLEAEAVEHALVELELCLLAQAEKAEPAASAGNRPLMFATRLWHNRSPPTLRTLDRLLSRMV